MTAVAAPTPEAMLAFKAALRKRAGNRCEAEARSIAQVIGPRLAGDDRCIMREGGNPPCPKCLGDSFIDVPEANPYGVRLYTKASGYRSQAGGRWVVACPACLGWGHDTKGPNVALKFHRLRGVAGEISIDDVMVLCQWCSAALAAKPALAASLKMETVKRGTP